MSKRGELVTAMDAAREEYRAAKAELETAEAAETECYDELGTARVRVSVLWADLQSAHLALVDYDLDAEEALDDALNGRR
jgi:hypothetical protein